MQIKLGDKEVIQDFVVCRQLKHDIILGADFGKNNCAGVEWTTKRTRVLSLNGIPVIEVEENEIGLPVTAAFHVKVPPRHNGVFQVNVHGDTKGTHIISANSQFLEKNPNVFQHEISIVSQDQGLSFPLVAVTNLDFAKTLHIGKGEIIGFARPESEEVLYIATTEEVGMDPYVDNAPRNWVPPRKRKTLNPVSKTLTEEKYKGLIDESIKSKLQTTSKMMKLKTKEASGKENEDRLYDESPNRRSQSGKFDRHPVNSLSGRENEDRLHDESPNRRSQSEKLDRRSDESKDSECMHSWEEIQEAIESDFLICPGDIYPSRKVKLQDADVSHETLQKFESLCEEQHEAFSKNNQDIGKTQLIEMEIDTGSSVPLAQSPYTLPLKHYDWVRKEIETLEKAGVIERSLSPWASPVIVVPKKSAPDEPPRRRLCVDYRRVNALQQEVKRTDKSTGCLTLYPLPKIDEMFAKLGGAKFFSTIDL